MMHLSIFPPQKKIEISTADVADTLSRVLIELLPSLTPKQGKSLLESGITYLRRTLGGTNNSAISRLEEGLNLVVILCETPLIPRINPESFRSSADSVMAWMNEQFLDNEPLLDCFLQAFADLQAHRRYAGSTPAYF